MKKAPGPQSSLFREAPAAAAASLLGLEVW
jgi:hypothetical protein